MLSTIKLITVNYMETTIKTTERVLLILLKEPFVKHTATSLAKALNITRQGLWKSLNKLRESKLIILESMGSTKKSVISLKLQWKSPVTQKTLSLLLTKESLEYERWRVNFAELENYTSFFILFGSVLRNSKEANDIDILAVVNNKNNFKLINEVILKLQKTQAKKIYLIDLTEEEFKEELKKQNRAYLDAIKKGIILFGQDNYIKFIERTRET